MFRCVLGLAAAAVGVVSPPAAEGVARELTRPSGPVIEGGVGHDVHRHREGGALTVEDLRLAKVESVDLRNGRPNTLLLTAEGVAAAGGRVMTIDGDAGLDEIILDPAAEWTRLGIRPSAGIGPPRRAISVAFGGRRYVVEVSRDSNLSSAAELRPAGSGGAAAAPAAALRFAGAGPVVPETLSGGPAGDAIDLRNGKPNTLLVTRAGLRLAAGERLRILGDGEDVVVLEPRSGWRELASAQGTSFGLQGSAVTVEIEGGRLAVLRRGLPDRQKAPAATVEPPQAEIPPDIAGLPAHIVAAGSPRDFEQPREVHLPADATPKVLVLLSEPPLTWRVSGPAQGVRAVLAATLPKYHPVVEGLPDGTPVYRLAEKLRPLFGVDSLLPQCGRSGGQVPRCAELAVYGRSSFERLTEALADIYGIRPASFTVVGTARTALVPGTPLDADTLRLVAAHLADLRAEMARAEDAQRRHKENEARWSAERQQQFAAFLAGRERVNMAEAAARTQEVRVVVAPVGRNADSLWFPAPTSDYEAFRAEAERAEAAARVELARPGGQFLILKSRGPVRWSLAPLPADASLTGVILLGDTASPVEGLPPGVPVSVFGPEWNALTTGDDDTDERSLRRFARHLFPAAAIYVSTARPGQERIVLE